MSPFDTPEDRIRLAGGRAERPHGLDEGSDPEGESEEPWPEPVDFLSDGALTGIPEIHKDHLPEAIFPFVMDTAGRMGVDPASVALAAIVATASIADDKWQIQPKRYDNTWTEAPRLWGAIVGDPSVLKTPVIRACTAPLDHLDADARRRHTDEMRQYERDLTAWKDNGSDPSTKLILPRLDRYLAESTTIEALSEMLRVDHDTKQRAPASKVLLRQDEMAEWIAGFDQYRSGGKGGSDRGAYLRLYNGGRHTIDRVARGSFAIPNWSACVLGGIQPGPIQRIAREATDDGLLQRFIYSVADRQGEGIDSSADADARQRYNAVFPALAALHPPQRHHESSLLNENTTVVVVLHAEAHRHREAINRLARGSRSVMWSKHTARSGLLSINVNFLTSWRAW